MGTGDNIVCTTLASELTVEGVTEEEIQEEMTREENKEIRQKNNNLLPSDYWVK